MPARELPARPNLEQYKKQAKELVKAFRSGDNAALQRVRGDYVAVIDSLLAAGARIESGMTEWWRKERRPRQRMRAYVNA